MREYEGFMIGNCLPDYQKSRPRKFRRRNLPSKHLFRILT